MASLLRPSALAKAWGLNGRTVTLWLREGKLRGVKTPGNHFRVRSEDVRAFCEAEGLPLPRFASSIGLRVLVAKRTNLDLRPLRRALRAVDLALTVLTSGAAALLAAASDPPDALVLDAALPGIDVRDALTALRAAPNTSKVQLFVCEATKTKVALYEQAGARAVARRGDVGALADSILKLLP